MDRALAGVSGLLMWAVILVVPATYLGLWRLLPPTDLLLIALPLVVLVIALRTTHRATAVLGFPLSLLPLLLVRPDLTGPRIYGGGAFVAVLVASTAYVLATVRGTVRTPTPARRSLVLAFALALGFAVPAAALHFDLRLRMRLLGALGPHDGRVIALLGLIVFTAWAISVWRFGVRGLGSAWLRPHESQRELATFRALARLRPRTRLALTSALITALAAGLALWAYLRHNP